MPQKWGPGGGATRGRARAFDSHAVCRTPDDMQSLSALLFSLPQQPPRCAPLASRVALRGAALRMDCGSASASRRGALHVCAAVESGVGIMGASARWRADAGRGG